METKRLDIVYCLKANSLSKELKYSLRSLKNMPHHDVWIYGGCPEWLDTEEVHSVPLEQKEGNKWRNTGKLLEQIALDDRLTENIIWFNDDFYVLKKTETLGYYKDRTLRDRVRDFYKIHGGSMWQGGYTQRLNAATRELLWDKQTIDNYELHVPIIFNRKKLQEIIRKYPDVGAKRSLYGNNFAENAVQMRDVKIFDKEKLPEPEWEFLSTSDSSFRSGAVGEWVRKKFNRRCKYEKTANE